MEGVKGVKGGLVRAWPGGPSGLALLKGVDRCEIYPPCVEELIVMDVGRRIFVGCFC